MAHLAGSGTRYQGKVCIITSVITPLTGGVDLSYNVSILYEVDLHLAYYASAPLLGRKAGSKNVGKFTLAYGCQNVMGKAKVQLTQTISDTVLSYFGATIAFI